MCRCQMARLVEPGTGRIPTDLLQPRVPRLDGGDNGAAPDTAGLESQPTTKSGVDRDRLRVSILPADRKVKKEKKELPPYIDRYLRTLFPGDSIKLGDRRRIILAALDEVERRLALSIDPLSLLETEAMRLALEDALAEMA